MARCEVCRRTITDDLRCCDGCIAELMRRDQIDAEENTFWADESEYGA